MNIKGAGLLVATAALLPATASAANLNDVLNTISNLINGIIPLVLAIAVLIFFWGLALYLINAGDTDKRGQGIQIMIMGVIVIFVMVSLWGIIGVLRSTFNVDSGTPIIPAEIGR